MKKKDFKQEMGQIARLDHYPNEFTSRAYRLSDYPEVLKNIEAQLEDLGYRLIGENEGRKGLCVSHGRFEIQTHFVSVNEHTDDVPLNRFFALLPVKCRVSTKTSYQDRTALRHYMGRKKQVSELEVGKLIVFNPRLLHELIFYGRATTFMIFTVKKVSTCKSKSAKQSR